MSREAWALATKQHGVITRRQLLDLGLSAQAVRHRIEKGRLYPVARGVYAVGRPELTTRGHWMAAVVGCGLGAALSYGSAAALWGVERERRGAVEVSVPVASPRRQSGVLVYRRPNLVANEVVKPRVDFLWPDLKLVVETDGLWYHRTPSQQARDRVRDQSHQAAGFTPLRFTHAQVRFEAEYVRDTLLAVVNRLRRLAGPFGGLSLPG